MVAEDTECLPVDELEGTEWDEVDHQNDKQGTDQLGDEHCAHDL